MQFKIIILLTFFTSLCFAAEKTRNIYIGLNYPNYEFNVKDNNQALEAKMIHSKTTFPTAGIGYLPRPLWGNYIRWSMEFSIAPFSSNRQIVNRLTDQDLVNNGDGKEANLGTRIHGYVTYFNPTLDIYLPYNDDYYFYFGVGIGLGYANIWGNYYQTDENATSACKNSTTKDQLISNCSLNNVSYGRLSQSVNVLLVFNFNNFALRYDIGGPEVKYMNKRFATYNKGASIVYQYRF